MCKWFNWRISDLRSVSAQVNARGYPCTKGWNSSASQWLSGEQVRLCSGHPKVHFGTIVEGSWGGWRGCSVGPPGSLTKCVLSWASRHSCHSCFVQCFCFVHKSEKRLFTEHPSWRYANFYTSCVNLIPRKAVKKKKKKKMLEVLWNRT